jgi:hypothetical protein
LLHKSQIYLDFHCDNRYICRMTSNVPNGGPNVWRRDGFPEDSGIPEIGRKSLRSLDSGNSGKKDATDAARFPPAWEGWELRDASRSPAPVIFPFV